MPADGPMADNQPDLGIQIDLIRDAVAMYRRSLIRFGYDRRSVNRVAKNPVRLLTYYYGVTRRLVTPRCRKIHKARGFACPEKHRKALAAIERRITNGDDLSPHLSTKIGELKNVDTLLNGWGVHHLHLGDRVEKKGKNEGFVQRDDPVLLCHFTETDAYFLEVIDHDSFSSQSVIDIMLNNWPSLLSARHLPGVTLHPADLSNEDVFKLTEAGYMTPVAAKDGSVYMPAGGGASASRDNLNDVIATNRLLTYLSDMQKTIVRHLQANRDPLADEPQVRLMLCVDRGKYCVRDLDTDDLYEVPAPGVVLKMEGALAW